MLSQYKFSNLLGTVYRKGDLVFSHDGNTVYAPVGNKITCYDLRNNCASTLPVEVRGNFTALTLSPNELILLGATDNEYVHMISVRRRRLLYSYRISPSVTKLAFSPDGNYFAAANGSSVLLLKCGGMEKRVYNPFNFPKKFLADGDVMSLDWSYDSKFLAFGATDCVTRVLYVPTQQIFVRRMENLSSHSSPVVGVYFKHKTYDLYAIGQMGKIEYFTAGKSPEDVKQLEESYLLREQSIDKKEDSDSEEEEPAEYMQYSSAVLANAGQLLSAQSGADDKKKLEETAGGSVLLRVASCCYHALAHVMVVSFTSGEFIVLNTRDECEVLHSLNVSNQAVTSVAINKTGDWVALGVSSVGQLLVWELQSETYVLKQQGHNLSMSVVTYSPDGATMASGGLDGKVKIWSTVSSFCTLTFSEHTDAVTGIVFTQNGRAVLSSSLDGTVRAFDMVRYRHFKTLTSANQTQFSCLSVDSSGDLVAAGGQDTHEIYLWSLKLGHILDVLKGHTGPVTSVCFSPAAESSLLVSTAWDQTLMLWNSIDKRKKRDPIQTIQLPSDGVCCSVRPDGQQVCVSTMDGQLTMFSIDGDEKGSIMGRADLGISKDKGNRMSARENAMTKYFNTLVYSCDGQQVLAGGVSPYLCVYSAAEQLLLKTYKITRNTSYSEDMSMVYSYKRRRDIVLPDEVERRPDRHDVTASRQLKLPGVVKGDQSLRTTTPAIKVSGLAFAPTGRSFVACCTEGLLVYSQDNDWLFDPIALDVTNTPAAVRRKLRQQEWGLALMMSIRLNINTVKQEVLETIPIAAMGLVVAGLAPRYVEGLLLYLAEGLQNSRHVGVYARWTQCTLHSHAVAIKTRAPQLVQVINALHRSLDRHHTTLNKLCASNEYTLAYQMRQCQLRKQLAIKQEKTEDQDSGEAMSDDESLPSSPEDEDSSFLDSGTDTEMTTLYQ